MQLNVFKIFTKVSLFITYDFFPDYSKITSYPWWRDFLTDEVLFFTSQIFLINHLLYLYLQTLIKEKLRFYSFLHWKS